MSFNPLTGIFGPPVDPVLAFYLESASGDQRTAITAAAANVAPAGDPAYLAWPAPLTNKQGTSVGLQPTPTGGSAIALFPQQLPGDPQYRGQTTSLLLLQNLTGQDVWVAGQQPVLTKDLFFLSTATFVIPGDYNAPIWLPARWRWIGLKCPGTDMKFFSEEGIEANFLVRAFMG